MTGRKGWSVMDTRTGRFYDRDFYDEASADRFVNELDGFSATGRLEHRAGAIVVPWEELDDESPDTSTGATKETT